jgi:hypothetical protein
VKYLLRRVRCECGVVVVRREMSWVVLCGLRMMRVEVKCVFASNNVKCNNLKCYIEHLLRVI